MAGDPSGTWSETTAGTTSGATATHAAVTGAMHIVRHISGHTDANSILTITDGGSVVFETKVKTASEGFAINIPDGIHGTPGQAVAGVIATSTADCQVNISGYSVPGNSAPGT